MNREDRAKQFAPFDALKGLREALAEKEMAHEKKSRKVLSEEEAEDLQNNLIKLKKGYFVKVLCFENGFYVSIQGEVKKIDFIYKFLSIGEGKVFFNDIYKIEIL